MSDVTVDGPFRNLIFPRISPMLPEMRIRTWVYKFSARFQLQIWVEYCLKEKRSAFHYKTKESGHAYIPQKVRER